MKSQLSSWLFYVHSQATNKQASKQKTRWPSKAAGFLQASRSD
jgi:hypothetical protein